MVSWCAWGFCQYKLPVSRLDPMFLNYKIIRIRQRRTQTHMLKLKCWLSAQICHNSTYEKLRTSSKSHLIVSRRLRAKALNIIYDKYYASLRAPPISTSVSASACTPFHLTPTFWTKIFIGTSKKVFFCCAFLRQETLFSCKLLTGSPRTMQL